MGGVGDNSVSAQQIRSFTDRILRLKEEGDALNADIREIYAEAKASGYDKTVLGKLVAHLRKRQKDPEAAEEQDAIFTAYLNAYEGGSHAHARARENIEEIPLRTAVDRSPGEADPAPEPGTEESSGTNSQISAASPPPTGGRHEEAPLPPVGADLPPATGEWPEMPEHLKRAG